MSKTSINVFIVNVQGHVSCDLDLRNRKGFIIKFYLKLKYLTLHFVVCSYYKRKISRQKRQKGQKDDKKS